MAAGEAESCCDRAWAERDETKLGKGRGARALLEGGKELGGRQ